MSRIKQFSRGFGHIRKGFSFFFAHKKLWWYAVIPTAINLIVLVAMIFLLAHYFGDLTSWIFGTGGADSADAGILAKVWHYTFGALIYFAKIVLFIIFLMFLLIITFVLSMILAEPFNDLISEKVEQIASGTPEIPFSWSYLAKSIKRSIVVGLQKAAFFLFIPFLLLILNLIPVIGSAIYLVMASLFAAFDIGFNFIDYPMSRRLMTFGERMRLGWSNRYCLTGFGIVALIPLFPYIFAAPLVVGGTLLFNNISSPLRGCCRTRMSS